ncbi:MAG: hypothetical protein IPN95_21050 [Bacteroidetes bacterium]|nr:hypothetical protein [Bacteroidota bacterium]
MQLLVERGDAGFEFGNLAVGDVEVTVEAFCAFFGGAFGGDFCGEFFLGYAGRRCDRQGEKEH